MGGEYTMSQPNLRVTKLAPPGHMSNKPSVTNSRGESASRNAHRSPSPNMLTTPHSAGGSNPHHNQLKSMVHCSDKNLIESLRVQGERVSLSHSIDAAVLAAGA